MGVLALIFIWLSWPYLGVLAWNGKCLYEVSKLRAWIQVGVRQACKYGGVFLSLLLFS